MFVSLLVFFLFIVVIVVLLTSYHHIFYRNAFTEPKGEGSASLEKFADETPFVIENDLPFPAGIRRADHPKVSLDGKWKFAVGSDSSSIKEVDVPSCFNNADSDLRDYVGIVTYQREFTITSKAAASIDSPTFRLCFQGSFYSTTVLIDGKRIGKTMEDGYLPFYYNITPFVKIDKKHTITVIVDNSIKPTSLPPFLFEGHNVGWHQYGGLHRPVYIELLPTIYTFKLKVEQTYSGNKGIAKVIALLHCTSKFSPLVDNLFLSISSPGSDENIESVSTEVEWDNEGIYGRLQHCFIVQDILKWSPSSPNLYTVSLSTDLETLSTRFGFCRVKVADKSIRFNDESVLLKGVSRHQEDRKDGLAQKAPSVKAELESIIDCNGNFVRLAHYPHSIETLDLCDELGLFSWVEIPLYQAGLGVIRYIFDKTKRDTGKKLFSLPRIFWETNGLEDHSLLLNARSQMMKLMERDINHPSILFWGLGNECWTFNPSGASAIRWLRSQVECFDVSRLFAYAGFAFPILGPIFERVFDVVDIVGINEYFGWYYGKPRDCGAYLANLARRNPGKPIIVTETGCDTVPGRFHKGSSPAPRHSEEYQCSYYQEQWEEMRKIPTFSGLSIWILKDFLCPEYREDNPVPFYNLKGILDRDGKPKKGYYALQKCYKED